MNVEFKSWKPLLSIIIKDSYKHAMLLKIASELEWQGAYWISRYAMRSSRNPELLEHCSEEFYHAAYFAKQVQQMEKKHHFRVEQRRVAFMVRHVIQKLNAILGSRVGSNSADLYHLVTFAIETFACSFYQTYMLEAKGHPDAVDLSWLLEEEVKHLKSMRSHYDFFNADAALLERATRELNLIISECLHALAQISNHASKTG